MTWSVQFYNSRLARVARYSIEAPLPPEAIRLGWQALLADHPRSLAPRRRSLFQQANRAATDAGGWVLYRIGSGAPSDPAKA
jgi:hypothetical protein